MTIEIIILMTRIGENPMAKYSLKDFVKVLKSMRSLRVAFDNLMEGYRCLVLVTLIIILCVARVYKNNQEEKQADKKKADIGDDEEDEDKEEDDDKKEVEDEEGDEKDEEEEDEEEEEEYTGYYFAILINTIRTVANLLMSDFLKRSKVSK